MPYQYLHCCKLLVGVSIMPPDPPSKPGALRSFLCLPVPNCDYNQGKMLSDQGKIREKSGNFKFKILWEPCLFSKMKPAYNKNAQWGPF